MAAGKTLEVVGDGGHLPKDPDTHCNGKKVGRVNEYCGQAAGWGTNHPGVGRCKRHGGAAPGYDKKAEELRARQGLEQYGLPRDVDPHTALLEELARAAGHVEWLRQRVAELKHDGVRSSQTHMVGPVGGAQGGFPEYKPNVWIKMYNEERKHLAAVAKTCIEAGIEERRVQIAEQQGQLLADVIKAILGELGVLNNLETPGIVRKHLTMIAGGQA